MILFLFQVLTQHCRNIRSINITKCNHLNETGLKLLIKNNPNLLQVNLSFIKIINALLLTVVIHCKKLKYINLCGCVELDTGGLEILIYHQNNIQYLDLTNCSLLSEKCIIKAAVKFFKMKSILLSGIPSITDFAITKIYQHCKELKYLNVEGCSITYEPIR